MPTFRRHNIAGPLLLCGVFLLSPIALFALGEVPSAMTLLGPMPNFWQLSALFMFWVIWVVVCVRARVWWPLLFTALFPIAWFFFSEVGLSIRYPCWNYSNATWCGHFCDEDPCECPARARGAGAYGGGRGCMEP